MTNEQFKEAVTLAKSDTEIKDDIDIFDGYGLNDFKPVFVTLRQVARLIRWQCATFAGTWDSKELQSIQRFGRKRFQIID
jgi:hypothetical protein